MNLVERYAFWLFSAFLKSLLFVSFQIVKEVLGQKEYIVSEVNSWSDKIVNKTLEKLKDEWKMPYKFMGKFL